MLVKNVKFDNIKEGYHYYIYYSIYQYTSISGNNVRKFFLESCSGIPPLNLLYFWHIAGNYIPLKLRDYLTTYI